MDINIKLNTIKLLVLNTSYANSFQISCHLIQTVIVLSWTLKPDNTKLHRMDLLKA